MEVNNNSIGAGPPEVMEMIFSLLDVDDIKICRLVNWHWHGAVQPVLDKRVRLNLEKANRKSLTTFLNSPRVAEFKNIAICMELSRTLENHFKSFLTSLELKNVSFSDHDEVRRVCFTTFGKMKELSLESVRVLNQQKATVTMGMRSEQISKVEKLRIRRAYIGKGEDVFVSWNFNELIGNFRTSLKEIQIFQGPIDQDRENFFEVLQENAMHLTALTYHDIDEAEKTAFREYFITHGSSLRILDLGAQVFDLFNQCFESQDQDKIENLVSVSINLQDWSLWQGKVFLNLKELITDQRIWSSFDFLSKMPNLEVVRMQQDAWIGHIRESCSRPRVHKLTLHYYRGYTLLPYRTLFPSVTTLILDEATTIPRSGNSILRNISDEWPTLMHLEFRGDWSAYLCPFVPEDTDDLELYGKGVGNENMIEFEHLPRLANLRSYVHNDKQSVKLWYGDECGRQIFLAMNNLRTLQIGHCAMSQEVIMELRLKLMCLTYKQRS